MNTDIFLNWVDVRTYSNEYRQNYVYFRNLEVLEEYQKNYLLYYKRISYGLIETVILSDTRPRFK